jgi:hypothetical protein
VHPPQDTPQDAPQDPPHDEPAARRPFPSMYRGPLSRLGALLMLPIRALRGLGFLENFFSEGDNPIGMVLGAIGLFLALLIYPFTVVVGLIDLCRPGRRDAIEGTVVSSRRWFTTARADLATARFILCDPTVCERLDKGVRLAVLDGDREVNVVVFSYSIFRKRCLPVWALTALADAAATNPQSAAHTLLREQAAHLAQGQPLKSSPMRHLVA